MTKNDIIRLLNRTRKLGAEARLETRQSTKEYFLRRWLYLAASTHGAAAMANSVGYELTMEIADELEAAADAWGNR